ncbi:hypothetical protein [Hymenobacter swuensis]|uniref:hypothetical protein n=1 Tax=Hymenobacter swuensis TaxID=1446467 RepID=UPI0005C4A793|nr:hypothetical protein [Hymenobacter swuensis]
MLFLLLNCELPITRIQTLLGRLFAIDAGKVMDVLSVSSTELYYDLHLLAQSKTPRSAALASSFFVELGVYPHGQLEAIYDSQEAFARAFSRESQLPVLVSGDNMPDPYTWLLFEAELVYEVKEWPEDEETQAITVFPANKKLLPPG